MSSQAERVSLEELRRLAEQAGLNLSTEELEHLRPLYDLYAIQTRLVHSVDLKSEESGVIFRPDWG